MSRSLSSWSSAHTAKHAHWALAFKVSGVPSIANWGGLSRGTSGNLIAMTDSTCVIGPELDWRSGVATWENVSFSVLNGFDSVAGTSGNNTFERWSELWEWESVGSVFIPQTINDATPAAVDIGAGSTSSTTGITIFTAYVTNVSQSDFGPLTVHLAPRRDLWLNSTFLHLLGHPPSANLSNGLANIDQRVSLQRPFNYEAEEDFVPLVYGRPQFAKGVVPHLKPTIDLTNNGYGLVVVFSDNRFTTPETNDPVLYVPGDGNSDPVKVLIEDYDGDVQYEWIDNTNPMRIGGTSGARGAVVGFTDDADSNDNGRSANGFLIAKRVIQLGWAQGADAITLGRVELDDDDSTYESSSSIGASSTAALILRVSPDDEFSTSFYRVFLRLKFATDVNTTWTAQAYQADTGGTAKGRTIGSDPSTNLTYNNWTSGTGYELGFESDSTKPFTQADEGLSFLLQFATASYPTTSQVDVYGGEAEVWYELPWERYWKRLYGQVDGINDATYRYDSSGYLKNPAEIAGHFIEEVCGGSIDSTNFTAESAKMDTDGIELAFQLTDGEQTARKVLDKIADQGMCWIYPADDGDEHIVYRPGITGTDAAASTPFSSANGNIIKGSFNWSLTPREDVYTTVVVNYNWNAITGKYDSQKVIAPTAGPYATDLTSGGTTYTAYADSIAAANLRPLIVNADMICDDDTAERYCKWLFLLHARRRQIVEFDAPMSEYAVTVGDLIYIDQPQIRVFASGDSLLYTTGVLSSNATTYSPSADTTNKGFGAVHDQDMVVIESGTYEGSYRLSWNGTGFDVSPAGGFAIGTYSISEPWRVLPGFDVLYAPLVYDSENGPRMHIKAVEHPVFMPMDDDL